MQQKNQQFPLAQMQPHKAESYIFSLQLPAAVAGRNQVIQGPSMSIRPGAQISVRPVGPNGVNANACFMSNTFESALHTGIGGIAGPVVTIAPAADVSVPWVVDNLNEIWFTAGQAAGAADVNIVVLVPAVG